MKLLIITLLLIFSFSLSLRADVYLLKDFWKRVSPNKNTVQNIDGRLRDLLDFESLFEEDIIINGSRGVLNVGLLNMTYAEFLEHLRYLRLKNISFNSLNTMIKSGRMRYLVYNAGDFSKAVCFAFNIANSKSVPPLPYIIPNPGGGAVHERVIEFPDRKTVYVTFNSVYNAEDAVFNCESQLNSQGFKRIGSNINDHAGFFMTSDGSKIVMMNFNAEHKDGFIYYKESNPKDTE